MYTYTRNTLQKRLWSILLGHTTHSVNEPRYLSPKHDQMELLKVQQVLLTNHIFLSNQQ